MGNTIDPGLFLSNKPKEANNSQGRLGKDDFMKILITQLQHQDPLNPMQDKEFIAQMASFSSLEQMTNLNKSFDTFVKSSEKSQFIGLSQLVGKQVEWQKTTEENEETIVSQGKGSIQSVQFTDGEPYFILDDGTEITQYNILDISAQDKSTNRMIESSHLIGKEVTWVEKSDDEAAEDDNERKGEVKSVLFKQGQTSFLLQTGEIIGADQIVKISQLVVEENDGEEETTDGSSNTTT